MSEKPSITNSTTISVSLVVSLLVLAFSTGVLWSRVNQIASNDEKASVSAEKLIEESSKTRTDLATFSLRLDSFGERLDDFGARLDNFSSQTASTVRVVPAQSTGTVTVVRNTGMQPSSSQQTIQPAPPQQEPEAPEPEPTPEPPLGSPNILQQTLENILEVVRL